MHIDCEGNIATVQKSGRYHLSQQIDPKLVWWLNGVFRDPGSFCFSFLLSLAGRPFPRVHDLWSQDGCVASRFQIYTPSRKKEEGSEIWPFNSRREDPRPWTSSCTSMTRIVAHAHPQLQGRLGNQLYWLFSLKKQRETREKGFVDGFCIANPRYLPKVRQKHSEKEQ